MMNEKLRALYKGALQGSTMGLADEAIGGVGALYARALNPELFQGDSFSNTYAQARDSDRAENKQLEQNNPWTYGGANLVGGVAMPMGMAGQGLKGAVKAGGIAGGLTGYGMSENTNPYALALDTATGAGLGAGAGAALYGAGKVATNPQVQKFAKDYIADESGALTIGGKLFDKSTLDEDITRFLDDKIKAPQKVYRGISEESGGNMAAFGQGLYSTPTKSIAKKYGKVSELSSDAIPNNPIKFRDAFQFKNFIGAIADKMGVKKNNMGVEYEEIIKELGYDGVLIGQGKDSIVVKYNADESGALKLFNNNDTTKLYRGLTKEYDPSYNLSSTDAPLGYSTWTDNPELAKQYAGKSGFVYEIELPNNKKGIEMIDKNGERFLFLNNQKKAGLNKISGDEYLIYNYHDDFSPNLIKKYENK